MIKLSMLFKKTVLVALAAALALAAFSVTSVYASGLSDSENPPIDIQSGSRSWEKVVAHRNTS